MFVYRVWEGTLDFRPGFRPIPAVPVPFTPLPFGLPRRRLALSERDTGDFFLRPRLLVMGKAPPSCVTVPGGGGPWLLLEASGFVVVVVGGEGPGAPGKPVGTGWGSWWSGLATYTCRVGGVGVSLLETADSAPAGSGWGGVTTLWITFVVTVVVVGACWVGVFCIPWLLLT